MAEEIKRTYTIPLRRGYANTPRYKRTNKAVRVLKKFLVKHMKSEKVKIGPKLNDLLWVDGIKNPPGKVTVDVTKDADNIVRAELTGIDYVDFKQQEKVEAPKNLQDKLKATVADVKSGNTQSSKTTNDVKTETEAPKANAKETKTEAKPVVKEVKAEAPKKAETPKVEKTAEPVKEVSETTQSN